MGIKIDERLTRDEFLLLVKAYISKDPEAAPLTTQFIQQGISASLVEAKERACDFELATFALLKMKPKEALDIYTEKINKWKSKSSLNWSWFKK